MIIKLSKRKDPDKSLNFESLSIGLTIVCVPTTKNSGPNVKICGIINVYMDFGFRAI